MKKCAMCVTLLCLTFCVGVKTHGAETLAWPDFEDLPAWEAYLAGGADVNAADETGKTALHWAVSRNEALAAFLIKHGAEVDYREKNGMTPLMLAAGNEEHGFACVPILIAAGADVNATDLKGCDVLVRVRRFDAKIVKQLLDAGLVVAHDCVTQGQRNPEAAPLLVMPGTKDLDPEGARLVLDAGPNFGEEFTFGSEEFYEEQAYNLCVGKGNYTLDKLFLERGIIRFTPERDDSRMLFSALGNEAVVKMFLEHGANPNVVSEGGVPVLAAAIKKNMKSARVLLENGARVSVPEGVESPLFAALEMEDEPLVREFLARGADVNAVRPKTGETPLMLAVTQGDVQTAGLLLDAGADVHGKTKKGQTLLLAAAWGGDLPLCKKLVAVGLDVNAADGHGWSPLAVAIYRHEEEMARFLVEHGASLADPEFQENWDVRPPLWMAAKTGNLALCKFLVEHGARCVDTPEDKWKLLHFAALGGNPDVCAYVLAFNPDVNARNVTGATALKYIVGADAEVVPNAPAVCEYLIARGADVNAADRHGFAAVWAVHNGKAWQRQCRVIQTLAENGADLHQRRKYGKDMEFEESLMDRVLDPEKGFSPLVAKYLQMKSGVFPNAVAPDSLCMAAVDGDIPRVKRLLAGGKNVNFREPDGETPLHFAARAGQAEMCKWLAENGADVNAPGIHGGTPLHYAALFGRIKAVEALLDAGADVNRSDTTTKKEHQKITPLAWAVHAGRADVAEALVWRGADVTMKTQTWYWDVTPLVLAARNRDEACVKAILSGGINLAALVRESTWRSEMGFMDQEGMKMLMNHCRDFTARDKNGDTVLHWYVNHWPRREGVLFLLENGCDPAAKNHAGKTPADLLPDLNIEQRMKNRVANLLEKSEK